MLPGACASVTSPPSGGAVPTPQSVSPNILYVDPTNGIDSNSGRSPAAAKATIQAAYNAIPVVQESGGFPVNVRQGGLINLLQGRHDVGAGLNLFKSKPVEIVGPFRAQRRPEISGSQSADVGAVIYSSTKTTQLIGIGVARDTIQNGYGFAFRQITFEMRDTTEYAIKAHDTNFLVVEDCGARHFDIATTPNAWLVGSLNQGILQGQDTSWHRITNNSTTGCGLYEGKVTPPGGTNSNQHVISGNVCFGHAARTKAFIYLENCQGSTIMGNNLETGKTAIEFGNNPDGFTISTGNLIMGNSGESIHTWIKATRFYGNIVMDPGSRVPTRNQADPADNSKLYNLSKLTGHNIILDSVTTAFGDLYDDNPLAVVDAGSGNVRIDPTNYRARFGKSAGT